MKLEINENLSIGITPYGYNPSTKLKIKQSPLQRIRRIIKFYYLRGQNRENVNNVYRNIIKKLYIR
jgi:hypothetical protein